MNRISLLQLLIDKNQYNKFLEIGTHKGKTLLPLRCKYKTAVDPKFKIRFPYLLKHLYKSPANFRNRYFQMTSDKFFEKKRRYLNEQGKMDLIFIDGLHTFEASLKDVLNSLQYLKPKGTIVLHDCFPPTEASATPALSLLEVSRMNIPDWKGAWCGDVWKTIVYLREKYNEELEIFVLNADLGLGIIQFKKSEFQNELISPKLFDQVKSLNYAELLRQPERLIGLRDKDYILRNFNEPND